VIATESDVKVNVFVFTHACDAVSAADPLNVPAVDADHKVMWDSVSVVETLVQGPAVPVMAFDPADAAAIVACFLVVSPAAAAVAPAAPGSAVCSFTQQFAVANVPSSHPFTAAAASPTAISVLLQ
jgi:hypothetical protein